MVCPAYYFRHLEITKLLIIGYITRIIGILLIVEIIVRSLLTRQYCMLTIVLSPLFLTRHVCYHKYVLCSSLLPPGHHPVCLRVRIHKLSLQFNKH
jgi:hypothetical protein